MAPSWHVSCISQLKWEKETQHVPVAVKFLSIEWKEDACHANKLSCYHHSAFAG